MNRKRRGNRLSAMALLVLFAATTEGCGLLIVKGPPEGHEQMDYFTCDEGDAGPILDLVSAGLNIGTAILCAADPDSYEGSYYDSDVCVALGLGSGALLGTSAAVGFGKTKKCRDAKRQLAERQAQQSVPAREEPVDIRVQSVILTPSADSLTVGERLQMTASAYNSSGAIIPNRMFAWSSSNDAIASVSSAGLVTAHASGEVVIAARTGDIVGTARLIVVARH